MAGKRGNSEGSIRKRPDGRWEARYRDVDGKRQSVYDQTRQGVVRQLNEAIRDRERGVRVSTDRQTVGDYLTNWLQAMKKREVKPSSYLRYELDVRKHLIPGLGRHQLTKLTAQQVQTFIGSKFDEGYAVATVHHYYVVLHNALDDAVRLGVVSRNVMDVLKGPRVPRHEFAIYNDAQARKLLEAVVGERLEATLVLALTTGMREGEINTLKWRDIDLDGGSLMVQRTLQHTEDGLRWDSAKTEHSRRRIALTELAVAALRRHQVCQAEERSRLGEAWQENDFVFTDAIGGRLSVHCFDADRWYGKMVKRAGLPMIRFHDLRHTAATLLLERGVNPKVVSEMLGHASVAVTLTLYGHVTPHMQREATMTMDRALGSWGSNRGSTPDVAANERGGE